MFCTRGNEEVSYKREGEQKKGRTSEKERKERGNKKARRRERVEKEESLNIDRYR